MELLEESLEWIILLDEGYRRKEAQRTLTLAQTVAAIFSENDWGNAQQALLDQIK